MTRLLSICVGVAWAGMLGGSLHAQGQPGNAPAPGGGVSLTTLNQGVQDLYKHATAGLLRIDVRQNALSALTPAQRADFGAFMANPPADAGITPIPGLGGGGGGRRGGERGTGGGTGRGRTAADSTQTTGGGAGGAGGGPGNPFGRGGGFGGPSSQADEISRFLTYKADHPGTNDNPATLRGLALRIRLNREGFTGELSAILLDNNRHALVPTGIYKEGQAPLKLTLPDGSNTNAKVVGANLFSQFTIIELEKTGTLSPVNIAANNITPGDLLLSVSTAQGSASLIVGTPRLVVPVDDRSAAYLFDTSNNLAAITSGGNWNGNRQALSASRLAREFDYIVKNQKDIEPRSLGLDFKSLATDAARNAALTPLLAGRRGLIITNVDANSLAAKAGLQKDDVLVSIDKRPVTEFVTPDGRTLPELVQFQFDLVTRAAKVPLGIIRKENGTDKEQSLEMPLD